MISVPNNADNIRRELPPRQTEQRLRRMSFDSMIEDYECFCRSFSCNKGYLKFVRIHFIGVQIVKARKHLYGVV